MISFGEFMEDEEKFSIKDVAKPTNLEISLYTLTFLKGSLLQKEPSPRKK